MARSWKPRSPNAITTPIAVLVLLLILFVSAGYYYFMSQNDLPPDNSGVLAEAERARARWDERRPPGYRYVVDRDCQCSDERKRPYTATERYGGREASFPIPVEDAEGRQLAAPTDPVWIDDLFRFIEKADAGGRAVNARFDSSWGFPLRLEIGGDEPDAETFEVRDFEIVDYE